METGAQERRGPSAGPTSASTGPTEKLSQRAKSRIAGMSGNYWYPVEQESNLKKGQVVDVVWWGTHIALWRTNEGSVYACENQCGSGVPLTKGGVVTGNYLVCGCPEKHIYSGDGLLVNEAEKTNGFVQPSRKESRLRVYPLTMRYTLIFLFPGDPAKSQLTTPPTIPWLDSKEAMPFKMVDFTVNSHWSFILENNCDFYHAYLHRKYKPFDWPELQWVERKGDAVQVHYRTDMGKGQLAAAFTPGGGAMQNMHLWFDYPYQRSNLVNQYLHWCFFLPISPTETRTFYIFLWGPISVFGKIDLPKSVRGPLLYLSHKFYLVPLLGQDRYALEEEQQRHAIHYDKHAVELNPLVSAFQKLSIEKWDDYLKTESERKARITPNEWRLSAGAGVNEA